jgi:RNA polymerase sigma-70 factor (ECF subfamily)
MFFSKSIAFDEEDIANAAAAARVSTAFPSVETEFIEKLKEGDPDAFDTLVSRYSTDIHALLWRLTEDPDEAGELTQETFLSAVRAIKGFRGDACLKTWLVRIAINHSRNRLRWWKRRKRERSVSLEDTIGSSDLSYGDTIAATGNDPEIDAIRRERQSALRKELIRLPDNFREVVVLCDVEGFTYEEAARALDINIGTVKSRLARGREELRRRLKDF